MQVSKIILDFQKLMIFPLLIVFFIGIFASSYGQITTLFHEDWEGNWVIDWHVDGGSWEVGTPTSGPDTVYSGNNCAGTVLNGNYPEPTDTRLIRHTSFIVPAASENPRFRFWYWFSFSSGDYGEVQIKTANGEWEPISNIMDNRGSDAWSYGSVDLSSYADSTVQIAFYFHSHRVGLSPNVSTGWYIDDVSLITGPYVLASPEDFESGFDDWSVDEGSWEVGIPTSGPLAAYGGQNCAGTNIEGDYQEPADSRLVSPPFVVPAASDNPRFRFWYWFSFSAGDYGEVHIKTTDGEWEPISNIMDNRGSDVWSYGSVDLSEYAGSTVQIGFYFHSHRVGLSANLSTGWYIDDVSLITGPYILESPEDFESGFDDWSVDEGSWEVGIPMSGPDSSYGGQNCAGTNLEGNYQEPADSRLVSPPFLVPAVGENPAIQFWHWFSFSADDYGEIQISTDDGATWETISNQFLNTSGGTWSPFYVSLSEYADIRVQIGFYFHSNRAGLSPNISSGWYVDDISIVGYTYPLMMAEPDSIEFGKVIIDSSKTESVVVKNIGTATMNIISINIDGSDPGLFHTDTSLFSITAGDSQYLEISFMPDSPGDFTATLHLYSDGGISTVLLSGTGVEDSTTSIHENKPASPYVFSLQQNYPNPFNPTTRINYSIPTSNEVRVKVIDMLGREVAVLVNEHKNAGLHSVEFDGSHLSSGVYFYQIQAGEFNQVRKMLLVK